VVVNDELWSVFSRLSKVANVVRGESKRGTVVLGRYVENSEVGRGVAGRRLGCVDSGGL